MDLWHRLKEAAATEAQALATGDHGAWQRAYQDVERLVEEIRSTGETPPPDVPLLDVLAPLMAAQKDSAARAARLLLTLRRNSAGSGPAPALFDGKV